MMPIPYRRQTAGSGLAAVLAIPPRVPVETMQKTMQHRSKHYPDGEQEYQPGVERIQPGEYLAAGRLRRIDRPHAAEQHGYVEKGITPFQSFEILIPRHSQQQRAGYKQARR